MFALKHSQTRELQNSEVKLLISLSVTERRANEVIEETKSPSTESFQRCLNKNMISSNNSKLRKIPQRLTEIIKRGNGV
jgi:hypothetical protein